MIATEALLYATKLTADDIVHLLGDPTSWSVGVAEVCASVAANIPEDLRARALVVLLGEVTQRAGPRPSTFRRDGWLIALYELGFHAVSRRTAAELPAGMEQALAVLTERFVSGATTTIASSRWRLHLNRAPRQLRIRFGERARTWGAPPTPNGRMVAGGARSLPVALAPAG